MWAAYSDRGDPEIIDMLRAAGADVHAKNKKGETAMTWAAWNGQTARGQDARPDAIRSAVEKSLAVLQPAGPSFFKKSACISCHHQALPEMAAGMARDRGFQFDEKTADREAATIAAFLKPAQEVLLEGSDVLPDVPDSGGFFLMALAAQKHAPDDVTAAVVHNIAMRQKPDGSWTGWSPRPPMAYGDVRETAVSIRALALYGPKGRQDEFNRRIERARSWLLQAQPATTEESIQRLFGLTWASATPVDIKKAAQEVLAAQRPDGGWAQLTTRESDAFATGEALVALHDSGALSASSPAYQAGVEYLLRTQTEDGSWWVKTRAFPFQPLIDSGFPHGRDQWISAAGTGWAAMALMLTAEPSQTTAPIEK
jgi:hypothetical protein